MQEIKNLQDFQAVVASNNLGAAAVESFQQNKKTSIFDAFENYFLKQENRKEVTSANINLSSDISGEHMEYLKTSLSEEDKKKIREDILTNPEIYETYKDYPEFQKLLELVGYEITCKVQ